MIDRDRKKKYREKRNRKESGKEKREKDIQRCIEGE